MKLRLRDFKGLYTNTDTADINPEFLKVARNIRYRPGYLETAFYRMQPYYTGLTLGEDEVVLYYDEVTIDNDPNANKLSEDELVPNYEYIFQKVELIVTYVPDPGYLNEYKIYYKEASGDWTEIDVPYGEEILKDEDELTPDVKVYNINGTAKIFLPHETLWFGKIDRTYWGDDIAAYNGFYLTRTAEPFDRFRYGAIIQGGSIYNKTNKTMGLLYTVGFSEETFNVYKEVRFQLIERLSGENTIDHRYNVVDLQGNQIEIYIIRTLPDGSFRYGDPNSPAWIGNYRLPLDYFLDTDPPVTTGESNEFATSAWTTIDQIEEWSTKGNLFKKTEYSIGDIGFTDRKFELLFTAILDNRDEFVLEIYKNEDSSSSNNYILAIENFALTDDFNKRVTGLAIYIKFEEETDFEQVKYFQLTSGKDPDYKSMFYITNLSPNGIYLNQTIGILFNESTHKLLDSFTDYTFANGVPYGLKDNKLHYPAVANGNISDAIFYSQSVIRNLTSRNIVRLSNIKETLAIHTKDELKFIIAQDSGIGEFLFGIKESAGYGIENRYAVEESPDGIFILTKQGIFLTTAQDDVLLSEQINDVIENNYADGRLVYDYINKELWFYIEGNNEAYVYSFVRQKWCTRNISNWTVVGNVKRMYVNDNGEIIVTTTQGSLMKIVEYDFGSAYIQTHQVDFGDIESLKQFQYMFVDYEGSVRFGTDIRTSGNRTEAKFGITTNIRYPVKKIDTSVTMINQTKLYAIEYSYDIVTTTKYDTKIII